jgi:hypothetical protein
MDRAVAYYAIVQDGAAADAATGLVRRRPTAAGPVDELLGRGLRWQASPALSAWETGDASGGELIEVSEAAAQGLIDRLRAEWEESG